MLVGLAVICVGGYVCLNGLWKGPPEHRRRARRAHHQHRLHHCSLCRTGGYLRPRQPPLPGIHPLFWRMAGARRSDRRRSDRHRFAADAALFPHILFSQPPKPENKPTEVTLARISEDFCFSSNKNLLSGVQFLMYTPHLNLKTNKWTECIQKLKLTFWITD